ncbi:hypothetical protein [Enterococcus sp. LJL90]
MNKWSNFTQKKKLLVIGGALGVVLVIGGGSTAYGISQSRQQRVNAQVTLQQQTDLVDEDGSLAKEISALFDSEQPAFLTADITQATMDGLQKKLDSAKKEADTVVREYSDLSNAAFTKSYQELESQLMNAEDKYTTQIAINEVFDGDTAALSGTTVHADLAIKEATTADSLSAILPLVADIEADEWVDAFDSVYNNAKAQVDTITQATDTVNALFDGDTPKEDVTQDSYNAAKEVVDTIKNETVKATLTDKLGIVQAKLDEKKAAEEAAAKAEAEAQAASTGGTVVQNEDGSYAVQAPATSSTSGSTGSSASGGSSSGSSSTYSGSNNSSSSSSNNNSYTPSSSGSSSGGSSSGSTTSGGSSGNSAGSSSSSGSNSGGSSDDTGGNSTGGTVTGGGSSSHGGGASWEGGTFDPSIMN